jgi:hypothetical protein
MLSKGKKKKKSRTMYTNAQHKNKLANNQFGFIEGN